MVTNLGCTGTVVITLWHHSYTSKRDVYASRTPHYSCHRRPYISHQPTKSGFFRKKLDPSRYRHCRKRCFVCIWAACTDDRILYGYKRAVSCSWCYYPTSCELYITSHSAYNASFTDLIHAPPINRGSSSAWSFCRFDSMLVVTPARTQIHQPVVVLWQVARTARVLHRPGCWEVTDSVKVRVRAVIQWSSIRCTSRSPRSRESAFQTSSSSRLSRTERYLIITKHSIQGITDEVSISKPEQRNGTQSAVKRPSCVLLR